MTMVQAPVRAGTRFEATRVVDVSADRDGADGAAAGVGPDAARGADAVDSFADLVMAPLAEGLWRHGDDELEAWLAESAGWQLALRVGLLRGCAALAARRVANTGMAANIAVNRVADLVAVRCGQGVDAARSLVSFAVAVCACPRVLAALAAGRVSEVQAKIICGLLDAVPEDMPGRSELVARIEDALIEAAAACRSSRRGPFAEAVVRFTGLLDPDGTAPAEDPQRNALSIARLLNGRYAIRGDVDALIGEQISAALSPLAAPRPEPDGTRDRRPAAQRRAEALAEVLRRYLCGAGPGESSTGETGPDETDPDETSAGETSAGETGTGQAGPGGADAAGEAGPGAAGIGSAGAGAVVPGGAARPQVHVHIRARDLADLPVDREVLLGLLRAGRVAEMFDLLRAGWTGFHGPMPAGVLRRIGCDAAVTPVITDEAGVPLMLGRTVRLATRGQRRALAARDGGCVFPGCGRPVGWTDAHHIVHWAEGGRTDLDNLVLLCSAHHRAVHHDGWEVAMGPLRRPVFRPPERVDPFGRWIDQHGLTTTGPGEATGADTPAGPGRRR